MNAALLSSKNMCWCTPQDFFDKLNAEFGFVLDPAATDKTAKCSLYYTPETDGLSQSWDRGGAVFCNPPYGREIGKWVQKAFEEARGGVSDCFTYPSADRHSIFSRLHIRESGNSLHSRAVTVHRQRRERRRSRALPFNGSYLQRGAGEEVNEGLFFRRADGKEIPVKEVEGLKGNGLLILTTEMLLRDEDLQKIQQSIEKRIGDGTRVLMLDARIKKVMRLEG